MTSAAKRAEIDRNYDAFQRGLSTILSSHRDQFALMHGEQIVEYFASPVSAYQAGMDRFPNGIFSIQEVTDEPIDLGFFSHAAVYRSG